jgi:hypothetical protein
MIGVDFAGLGQQKCGGFHSSRTFLKEGVDNLPHYLSLNFTSRNSRVERGKEDQRRSTHVCCTIGVEVVPSVGYITDTPETHGTRKKIPLLEKEAENRETWHCVPFLPVERELQLPVCMKNYRNFKKKTNVTSLMSYLVLRCE